MSKTRNILSQSDAEKFVNEKIRAFIALGWTIVIHYYSSLQKLHKKKLQLIENTAARVLKVPTLTLSHTFSSAHTHSLTLSASFSPPNSLNRRLSLHDPGSAKGLFLFKENFSFLLLPSACSWGASGHYFFL